MADDCRVIAMPGDSDIILSTYNRTHGTTVVIGCTGFGRHIDGPERVTCMSGTWSQQPKTTCKVLLDERERVELAVGLVCAFLVILVFIWLLWYCCCRRRSYRKRNILRESYRVDLYKPSFRESRKSYLPENQQSHYRRNSYDVLRASRPSFRRTRRFSDSDLSTGRLEPKYIRTEEPIVSTVIEERPVEVVYKEAPTIIYEKPPKIIYETREPEVVMERTPSYRIYTLGDGPGSYVPKSRSFREPADPVYNEKRRNFYALDDDVIEMGNYYDFKEINARLEPTVIDPTTVYIKYNTKESKPTNDIRSSYLPRAKITELPDDHIDDASVMTYDVTQRQKPIANGGIDTSVNYFFGRQDYPYEKRSSGNKDLDHVLYHGRGKMTKVFEEGSGKYDRHRVISSSDHRL